MSGSNMSIQRYAPPVNIAPVVKSGPKLTFSAGSRPGCLKMTYEFRLAQVVNAPTAAPAPYSNRIAFKVPGNGVPSYSFEIPVAPMNSYYFPTYIRQLILLFNELSVHNMTLSFQPRQSATSSNSFVWAYAEDIMWPESHGLLTGGATVLPTETALTSLSTACTNLTWTPCLIKANITDKKLRYVATDQFDGQLNYSTAGVAALMRQSMPGLFMLFNDGSIVSASETILGDVYCVLVLELCDFSTPITTEVTLERKRRERLDFPALKRTWREYDRLVAEDHKQS
jgi:hypothetical protein